MSARSESTHRQPPDEMVRAVAGGVCCRIFARRWGCCQFAYVRFAEAELDE